MVKAVTKRREEKTTIIFKPQFKINKQKLEITLTTSTIPKFQHIESNRHVIVGASNVGKTYFMLKILEKIGHKRSIHIISRSPNQYPNYKPSIDIKAIDKYKGSVVIFDDMLGAQNSSQVMIFTQVGDMKI